MKKEAQKVLLSVDYVDNNNKYFFESCIKNKIFKVEGDIHKTIIEAMEKNDFITKAFYKGQPVTNVCCDTSEGKRKIIGYIYRVENEIDDKKVKLDAWVTIQQVADYKFIDLEK